jgi:hypothetical protein
MTSENIGHCFSVSGKNADADEDEKYEENWSRDAENQDNIFSNFGRYKSDVKTALLSTEKNM